MSTNTAKKDLDLSTAPVDEINEVLIRTAYDGLNQIMSDATGIDFTHEKSLTQQNFADESDINNIMARYEKTGELPVSNLSPLYGDFTLLPDYMEAQNLIVSAREHFDSLPSKIRDRFHNDPAQFLAFCDDPENAPEMRLLGLLPPSDEVPNPSSDAPVGAAERPQTAGVAAPTVPA
ncbi:MAG: internal scaffolding protein [Microviridae sp.]|nr:MAG: internal scaffolding protein [Microviridae sp.]